MFGFSTVPISNVLLGELNDAHGDFGVKIHHESFPLLGRTRVRV